MPSGATPAIVAIPSCGVWPTVFCGVLAADLRLFPFRILRCTRNQRARHIDAAGLRDSSETRKPLSTTRVLPDGRIPTTGSPITEDIGQAGLLASDYSPSPERPGFP